MKIEQILIQPIGQRFNAGTLTIKTSKKTWQVGKIWFQQIICMDSSGEIPADVKIGDYIPLQRGSEIKVIVAEVREAEYLGKPCKILYVDQYSIVTTTVDDYNAQEEDWSRMQQDQIKGKIRHGIVCAITSREHPAATLKMKKEILELQEFILKGE